MTEPHSLADGKARAALRVETDPTAQSLVREGRCSAACMVGDETGACSCRCRGEYHGALAATPVPRRRSIQGEPASLRSCMPPGLRCAHCEKVIGKKKSHIWLSERREVWCLKCFSPHSGSNGTHAKIYPDCPHGWHDMYDHWSTVTDRALAAVLTGEWLPPGRYLDEWTPVDPQAWDFPDDCQVEGCVDSVEGLQLGAFPYKWTKDGVAYYQDHRGHQWTCFWGSLVGESGTEPIFRGVSI